MCTALGGGAEVQGMRRRRRSREEEEEKRGREKDTIYNN